MFIAPMSTIAKMWKEPRCPFTDDWIKKIGSYTQWNITQPSERTITHMCINMDGTGGDYAK